MLRRPPRSTLFPTRRSSDLFRGESIAAMSAQPISKALTFFEGLTVAGREQEIARDILAELAVRLGFLEDRKSTRLNSSHSQISYAVFCLKKKKNPRQPTTNQ